MAFGSFDSKGSTTTMSEINMVPLIDVMLVLLVIFIITAPLLSHSIKINVPQVRAEPVEQEPVIIDLAVNDLGQIFWNEQPIEQEALTDRFRQESAKDPQPQLRIRADVDTRYEILAQVMGSARAGGMKRMGFITRPGQAMPGADNGAAASTPAATPANATAQTITQQANPQSNPQAAGRAAAAGR